MITIFADTTSSIPPEEASRLGIQYLPQIIIFGNDSYRDDTEIDSATFIKKLQSSSVLPKTAAPPPALYVPLYEKYATAGNTVIVLCPSSKVSGTIRGAEVAAQDFAGSDIRIIDTLSIGASLAMIVKQAKKWVDEGLDADTVVAHIQNLISRERNIFAVGTLEYLYKGGRIGGAKMLFGSVLQVKPLLSLVKGQTEAIESQRTKKRAIARLKEIILTESPHDNDALLCIQHGAAENEAKKIAEELRNSMGLTEVPVFELPPAFLVHAGPGVIGACYFVK